MSVSELFVRVEPGPAAATTASAAGMSDQTSLRPFPRRRRCNDRLRGVPRRQIQAQARAPARVAGLGSPNGAIEVQLERKRCLIIARIAKIAQSVTPMTVIHSTTSAQSRIATLHLIVHELLAFLVVTVEIAMPAPPGIGDRIGRAGVIVAHRRHHLASSCHHQTRTSSG